MYVWSWNLYKVKNNRIQTYHTQKFVKALSENFYVNKLSEFFLIFMSTSQPSYLCSLSMRYELNISQKRNRRAKASKFVK